MKLSKIKLNPNNPRKISADKLSKLMKSIEEFPKMLELRPMIYDPETMQVLGGNQRLTALKNLGYKEIPDDWVKSAADLTEEEKRQFTIKDNGDFGEWDFDLLKDWDEPIEDWGVDLPEFEIEQPEAKDEKYTKKVDAPIYEPSEEKPKMKDLFDDTKTKNLIEEIEKSDIDEKDKELLRKAALRHLVFDYSKIADYYAHSNKEVQNLMEKSALVIIDFDKAIELGYVKLSKEIAELYEKDYE